MNIAASGASADTTVSASLLWRAFIRASSKAVIGAFAEVSRPIR
jgi:hypothetical protein